MPDYCVHDSVTRSNEYLILQHSLEGPLVFVEKFKIFNRDIGLKKLEVPRCKLYISHFDVSVRKVIQFFKKIFHAINEKQCCFPIYIMYSNMKSQWRPQATQLLQTGQGQKLMGSWKWRMTADYLWVRNLRFSLTQFFFFLYYVAFSLEACAKTVNAGSRRLYQKQIYIICVMKQMF